MDYTYREHHGEAIYRFKACPREGSGPALAKAGDGMLPSDCFHGGLDRVAAVPGPMAFGGIRIDSASPSSRHEVAKGQ